MQGLEQQLKEEEEKTVSLVFETIGNVVEQKSSLLNDFLPKIVVFICQLLANSKLADNYKESALDVIFQICENKRAVLTKNPDLFKDTIQTLCNLVRSSKAAESEDEICLQDSTL